MSDKIGKLELRKIPPTSRSKLCEILSLEDHWKTVMAHVLMSPEDSSNKYTADQVNIIDKHSKQTGKPGMDILLDEWGTSGRIRPTVEDLFRLCESLELYRAADFILEDLLGGVLPAGDPVKARPARPITNQTKNTKEQISETPNGYVNMPVEKTSEKEKEEKRSIVNFKLGMDMDTDELNKQLDSLIIESQELTSPKEDISFVEDISLIQSPLPHFAFGFLQTITNQFSDIPYRQGGNKIGAGAFGSVYYGKLSGQLGLVNTAIAVKRISRDLVKIEEQFNNEVEIMGLVCHQNLLTLLAYSCDGEDLCLLYPYMENGSVEERLAMKVEGKRALTPMQRLKIAHGSAEGLLYLHNASHSKPLVHRDIKTANILLDSNNDPKIGDFGLVRLGGGAEEEGRTSTVLTQTVVGTSAYMAPEAVRGEVTVKLDVFSFGVVILELLTGLPAMDQDRETRDLVGHMDELLDDDGEIEDHLDKKFALMEWRQVSPKQFYLVAQDCLLKKKDRPYMGKVCELIYALFH
eukprot:GFUD01032601.1.p1 GENE.GFUD01032601.1~~GFUD01032601.1.p1  ORF type:complete len:521 (-),score=145.69 GFUD01032601.1:60-1622(-)